MQARTIDLLKTAQHKDGIEYFKQEEVQAALKKTGMFEYLNIQSVYAKTHYGKYTLAAALVTASSLYLGALFLAPTMIPFGLAVISTAWIKYAVAAITLAVALTSGGILLNRTYQEALKLKERFSDNELSNYDVALLATSAVAGFGVVGMMYAFPTMLPFLGTLGTVSKAATASVVGAASAVAGYAAFFGRPARVNPPVGAVNEENEIKAGNTL